MFHINYIIHIYFYYEMRMPLPTYLPTWLLFYGPQKTIIWDQTDIYDGMKTNIYFTSCDISAWTFGASGENNTCGYPRARCLSITYTTRGANLLISMINDGHYRWRTSNLDGYPVDIISYIHFRRRRYYRQWNHRT